MSNERYVNTYIEIMTNTMTDAVIRNVSLQTNVKVIEDTLNELRVENEQLRNSLESETEKLTNDLEQTTSSSKSKISELEKQVSELTNKLSDYDSTKQNLQHLETFRAELIKEREEHQRSHNDYSRKIQELTDNNNKRIQELTNESNNKVQQLTNDSNKKVENLTNDYNKKIEELTIDFVSQLKILQDKVEYLKMSPAKRKKLDESKIGSEADVEEKTDVLKLSSISPKKTLEVVPLKKIDKTQEDGGTF